MSSIIKIENQPGITEIVLDDPAKRNAMSLAMFDALDDAMHMIAARDDVHVVLLRGEGSVFCAGFDLAAASADATLMEQFILRLSHLNRSVRRLPQVVVAAVQGAAIAGGCALLTVCDFVFAAKDAQFGYPVHRIGVSPAVNIPTLQQKLGSGAIRSLLMAGELISASEARRIGLVTHVSDTAETVQADAVEHCRMLLKKGTHALRVTKSWLNELDGSLDDAVFDAAAGGSASITQSAEATALLAQWSQKSQKSNSWSTRPR